MCRMEVHSVNAETESDQSSVERSHSRNQRRAKNRTWTDTETIENLGCYYTGQQCGEFSVEKDGALASANEKLAKQAKIGELVAARKSSRRNLQWTWKAFMHMECRGKPFESVGPCRADATVERAK